MRGLYIIVEGQTEEEFVNAVLREHFAARGIYDVRAILLNTSTTSKGGAMSFARYKRNAEILLKEEKDIIVTSLIDYYKLYTDFPGYTECMNIDDKFARVTFLEDAIAQQIDSPRFLPYIQLHEFEGLLFSGMSGFEYFGDISHANMQELQILVNSFQNPELINEGVDTAPSKHLKRLVPGYRKTLHGPIMALELTLPSIAARCVRFSDWLQKLVELMNK